MSSTVDEKVVDQGPSEQDQDPTGSVGPEKVSEKSPNEAMAKGLEHFLKPIVIECDLRIKEVFASQIHLSNQINQLNEGMFYTKNYLILLAQGLPPLSLFYTSVKVNLMKNVHSIEFSIRTTLGNLSIEYGTLVDICTE